jgi:hypothetical protein
MTLGKRALVAAAAIAAVFAGGLAVVDRLFDEPAATASRPTAPAAPAASAIDPALPPSVEAPPPAPAEGAPLPPPPAPAPAAAPAPPPPPALRRRDLQSSLGQARARILECAGLAPPDEPAGPARPRPPPEDEAARLKTVLLLELEPQEGGMTVLAVREGVRGGPHHDDLVRCATEELQGQVLEASTTRPGKPITMQFVVDPPRR